MPSYIVRTVSSAIIKITDSLDEAKAIADQFREMKLALGDPDKDAHCDVEQRIVVYSTMKEGV